MQDKHIGSGLNKIVEEIKSCRGMMNGSYRHFIPRFFSFTVVLKNVNYTTSQIESTNPDGGINGGLNGGLNKTQQKIIDLILDNPLITT